MGDVGGDPDDDGDDVKQGELGDGLGLLEEERDWVGVVGSG